MYRGWSCHGRPILGLSLGLVRLDRSLPLEIQPLLSPSCQLSVPFHPYFCGSLLFQAISLLPYSGCVAATGTPAGIPRKQREGFRLPNWSDNESTARGIEDVWKATQDPTLLS